MWLVLTLTWTYQIPVPFPEKCCDTLELVLPDQFTSSKNGNFDFSSFPKTYRFYDAKEVFEKQCAGLDCPVRVLNMPGYFLIEQSAYEDWDMFTPEFAVSLINPSMYDVFNWSVMIKYMYDYNQIYNQKNQNEIIDKNDFQKKNIDQNKNAETSFIPVELLLNHSSNYANSSLNFYNDDEYYSPDEGYAVFDVGEVYLFADYSCGSSEIKVIDLFFLRETIPNATLACKSHSSVSSTLSDEAIAGIIIGGVLVITILGVLAVKRLRSVNIEMDHGFL